MGRWGKCYALYVLNKAIIRCSHDMYIVQWMTACLSSLRNSRVTQIDRVNGMNGIHCHWIFGKLWAPQFKLVCSSGKCDFRGNVSWFFHIRHFRLVGLGSHWQFTNHSPSHNENEFHSNDDQSVVSVQNPNCQSQSDIISVVLMMH